MKNTTALVSMFARAYHSANNEVKIFDDPLAEKLLTKEEYRAIGENMAKGIGFFNPGFGLGEREALRWIVDNQLSPSPLGRSAFAERSLETAVKIGARQYLIFAAGYDTFAYRQKKWAEKLEIFELDLPETACDKRIRLEMVGITPGRNVHYIDADFNSGEWARSLFGNGFDKDKISFCSLLGISYYLSREAFKALVEKTGELVAQGSSIVFDYPDELSGTPGAGERAKKQKMLADAAGEAMLASYSYVQMETLLSDCGFRIYEHLTPDEITQQYFQLYNAAHDEKMSAFDNVNYCLAVKK